MFLLQTDGSGRRIVGYERIWDHARSWLCADVCSPFSSSSTSPPPPSLSMRSCLPWWFYVLHFVVVGLCYVTTIQSCELNKTLLRQVWRDTNVCTANPMSRKTRGGSLMSCRPPLLAKHQRYVLVKAAWCKHPRFKNRVSPPPCQRHVGKNGHCPGSDGRKMLSNRSRRKPHDSAILRADAFMVVYETQVVELVSLLDATSLGVYRRDTISR